MADGVRMLPSRYADEMKCQMDYKSQPGKRCEICSHCRLEGDSTVDLYLCSWPAHGLMKVDAAGYCRYFEIRGGVR